MNDADKDDNNNDSQPAAAGHCVGGNTTNTRLQHTHNNQPNTLCKWTRVGQRTMTMTTCQEPDRQGCVGGNTTNTRLQHTHNKTNTQHTHNNQPNTLCKRTREGSKPKSQPLLIGAAVVVGTHTHTTKQTHKTHTTINQTPYVSRPVQNLRVSRCCRPWLLVLRVERLSVYQS
jgi:hypothetical protein